MRRDPRVLWREWVRPMLLMVLALASVRSAVADWNDVPSGSMRPTILEGERIAVNKLAYGLRVPFTTLRLATWSTPQPGDIVILRSPEDGKRLVKRVIGVPGDVLELRDGALLINGRAVTYESMRWHADDDGPMLVADELLGTARHRIQLDPRRRFARSSEPITVPDGRYFVMGDNRDHSKDSRWFGTVEESNILGRVWAIAASVDPDRWFMPRWERWLEPVE